ncbi:uncharacterized protein LOC111122297 [Crassostrea virginica]
MFHQTVVTFSAGVEYIYRRQHAVGPSQRLSVTMKAAVLVALFLLSCSALMSEALILPPYPDPECPPNYRVVGTCYPPHYTCRVGFCIPSVTGGRAVCCKGPGFY